MKRQSDRNSDEISGKENAERQLDEINEGYDYDFLLAAEDKRISNLASTLENSRKKYISRKLSEGRFPNDNNDVSRTRSNSLPFFILVAVLGVVLLVSGVFLKQRRRKRDGTANEIRQTNTNDNWNDNMN